MPPEEKPGSGYGAFTTSGAEFRDLSCSGATATRLVTLSVLTVRSHVQRALNELSARDRAQLVVLAYQTGLVRPSPRVA